MDTNFSLRPATLDDLPQVLEIEKNVHVSPWTEENFKAELFKPYSYFLVVTDDETDTLVAGYAIFWLMLDECQILNLAMSLSYRGLGLAKKMISKIIFLANQQGAKKIILDVRKSNLPAIRLYQQFRFAITHTRKGFYGNGEDAYQMTLFLQQNSLES